MDVIVLGGGIVGLVMANLLAKSTELRIAVVEPNVPQLMWDEEQYDLRCSAITPAARQVLLHIGVWQEITCYRHGVFNKMQVWDQELHNKIAFDAHSVRASNLGHIIENRVLTKVLYQKLLQQANVVIMHATANDLQQLPDSNVLIVGSKQLECRLLIGADGANSWLRKKTQITNYGWDYQHTALVATIQTQHAHANTALQRFSPDGILAFLPLAHPNFCSIVWSCSSSKAQSLIDMPAAEFSKQLASAFCYQLGDLDLVSARASFPLRMLHATKYVLPRIALIGDAAHVIHPLAGQGLNLGILDAAALAEVLQVALLHQQDIGQLPILRKFERRRKRHNLLMIAGMEGIKRLFGTQNTVLSTLRAQGMNLLDTNNFAKNSIMLVAMGYGRHYNT